MLNYLWGGMLLIGIVYGGITGHMNEVTEAALSSAEEAVSLCITMAGIVAMWVGLMEIARASGLVDRLTNAMRPLLHFFISPDISGAPVSGIYICQYDRQFSGTWLGGNSLWAEGHGGAGESGGRPESRKSAGKGQKKGNRRK